MADQGDGQFHAEHGRTRRGSSIMPPAHWIGHEAAPRTAFITGASSGLGLALVKAFTEAGYKVFASCRKPEDCEELRNYLSDNGLSPPLQICLKSRESIQHAFRITQELTGAIDVFINNAGVLTSDNSPYDPVMEIGDEEMTKVYEVNVSGVLRVTQTFIPLVQASCRHPIIINISSPLGSLALNRNGNLAPYRCSKAALNMLTKTFAVEMPSIVFLSVSPRDWNHIPTGLHIKGSTNEVLVTKQDRRYSSVQQLDPTSAETQQTLSNTGDFYEDALKILAIASAAKKEDSGNFVFTDGEKVPF